MGEEDRKDEEEMGREGEEEGEREGGEGRSIPSVEDGRLVKHIPALIDLHRSAKCQTVIRRKLTYGDRSLNHRKK